MQVKFNTIIGVLVAGMVALSCSAPRYASAQEPDDTYNQPSPADDQDYTDNDADDQQDVDFNTFYDALSPYGTWEDDAEYGKVWVNNDVDFTPYYSNGNWAYSDAGWAWVSSYNWGWAPFHYGRWAFRNHWMWVPGYEWAPAWVSWRTGGDYYGWAPLSPGISIGIGASFGGYIPAERWNFCQRAYITNNQFRNYCLDRGRNITIIHNTTIINNTNVYHNTRFVAGPNRREVERYTNTRVNTMRIRNAQRPGAAQVGRNSIQIYRPTVRPGNNRYGRNNNNRDTRFQRPQGQNQRPAQQQPNNNNRRQFEQRPAQQQPNNQRPAPDRQRNDNTPNRPNTQPAAPQQRQPVYNNNRPRQNALNNNRDNGADRRVAFNQRRQVQPQEIRPQVQQPRERPQQQFRQQAAQPRQQAQQPRERVQQQQVQPRNNGGENRNNGSRERGVRRL